MIRAIWVILLVLIIVPAFAVAPPAGEKEVAIVHFSQLRAAKLEGTVKDMQFQPAIGVKWQQPYIRLKNDLLTPREITLRILDLTEPKYDVYLFDTKNHGNLRLPTASNVPIKPDFLDPKIYYAGKKTKDELESGIPVSFPGTFITPEYRDYITRLRAQSIGRANGYDLMTNKEADICRTLLQTVPQWIDRVIEGDGRMRTMSIVVVPAGQTLSLVGGGILAQSPDYHASVKNLGDSIQLARKQVVKMVKNPIYRYDTLEALTPVEIKLTPSKPLTPGSTVTIQAITTNWTDRAIAGSVKLAVPSGWKVREASAVVKAPPFRKSTVAKFEVAIPKTAKADANLSADADFVVDGVTVKLQGRLNKQ